MAAPRYLDVHYRRLVRDQWDGGTLAEVIDAALHTRPPDAESPYLEDWRLRVTRAPADEQQHRFANNLHLGSGFVFGNLCAYTGAEMQAIVDTGAVGGQDVDIQDLQAPSGRDYLHGIAYWLVVDDHCYVVQDARVRTKALEEYLTWLIRNALDNEESVTLQAVFDVSSVGDDLGDVTSVEIGGLAPETVRTREDDTSGTSVDLVQSRRTLADKPVFAKSREVLEAAFGTLETERLLERMPEDAALQVMLHVSYLSTSRKVDRTSMKDLGVAVRNLDDGEVRVRAKDGTIAKDEARLKARMPFQRVRENGRLLELQHVFDQLMETHRRFLADGKIPVE